jgi:hypothetical protein
MEQTPIPKFKKFTLSLLIAVIGALIGYLWGLLFDQPLDGMVLAPASWISGSIIGFVTCLPVAVWFFAYEERHDYDQVRKMGTVFGMIAGAIAGVVAGISWTVLELLNSKQTNPVTEFIFMAALGSVIGVLSGIAASLLIGYIFRSYFPAEKE